MTQAKQNSIKTVHKSLAIFNILSTIVIVQMLTIIKQHVLNQNTLDAYTRYYTHDLFKFGAGLNERREKQKKKKNVTSGKQKQKQKPVTSEKQKQSKLLSYQLLSVPSAVSLTTYNQCFVFSALTPRTYIINAVSDFHNPVLLLSITMPLDGLCFF